jgi:type II secretory pathway component GspD/PulD (secretin)
VGGDGQITMDMRPMVSTLTSFVDVPGGGSLPQTSLRIAQSTMNIKSGETIAIGGLIQDSDTISEGGIPILKDLPLIGKLFSRTNKNKRRSEIVFFVTAKVVDENTRGNAAAPARDEPKKSGN